MEAALRLTIQNAAPRLAMSSAFFADCYRVFPLSDSGGLIVLSAL